jgi:hypothetical protein
VSADRRGWRISDHVCRICLGRVLVTTNPDGTETARCSNCDIEADGDHRAICACGLKLKSGKSAGLRCVRNPNPTGEMPSRIVAAAS